VNSLWILGKVNHCLAEKGLEFGRTGKVLDFEGNSFFASKILLPEEIQMCSPLRANERYGEKTDCNHYS